MMNILEVVFTSVFSSSIVGVMFTFIFNKRLEIHKQELSKNLQRYSLYEQEKHKVYREYYSDLMHAQSAVRKKVSAGSGQFEQDLHTMNKDIMLMKNDIYKEKDEQELPKKISEEINVIEQKLIDIKRSIKSEIKN